jgi:hypothetical protein
MEGDIAACLTNFAPILMSFSLRVVSECLIDSGVASARKNLPRL